jgi:hypothetical protein
MSRRALSLVEVIIATLVLAGLGLAIYETVISSTRGLAADRLTEAKRNLVLDLLERFCQPYTDIPALFAGRSPPYVRQLTIDEVFDIVRMPTAERPTLKAILAAGKVEGFSLAWTPRLEAGRGTTAEALRLDALWCAPVVAGDSPGARVECFRIFQARGTVGE